MRIYKGSKYTIKVLLSKCFNSNIEDVAISFYTTDPENTVSVRDGIVVNGNIAEVDITPGLFNDLEEGLLMYTVYGKSDGIPFMGERQSNYYLKIKSDGTPPQVIEITENGEHSFVLNNGTKVNVEVNVEDTNGSYSDGFEAGQSKGYNTGYSDGYSSGETKGYLSGKTEGYSEGYTDGEVEGVKDFRDNLPFLTITENGTYNTENKGVSVNIKTNTPDVGGNVQDQRYYEITESGLYSIAPDDGYDSMNEVLVDVNVEGSNDIVLKNFLHYADENGVITAEAEEGTAWNKIHIDVQVPNKNIEIVSTIDYSSLGYNDDDVVDINTMFQNNIDTIGGNASRSIFAAKEDYSNLTSLANKYHLIWYSLVYVPDNDTTSNVTDFSSMFVGCSALHKAPMLNTTSAKDMRSMFEDCRSLTSVPLYYTSNVTDMSYMFKGCSRLETVPAFDTSYVTDMSSMFNSCLSLKSLPAFDCSGIVEGGMDNIFHSSSDYHGLTDLGGFLNLKANINISRLNNISIDSATNLINGLYDFVGNDKEIYDWMGKITLSSAQSRILPTTLRQTILDKGWTIQVA